MTWKVIETTKQDDLLKPLLEEMFNNGLTILYNIIIILYIIAFWRWLRYPSIEGANLIHNN